MKSASSVAMFLYRWHVEFSSMHKSKVDFSLLFEYPNSYYLAARSQAALAQSVERKALNLVVAGSSPAGGV